MEKADSILVRAALASRLVNVEQLQQAIRPPDGGVAVAMTDQLLGQRLVELGFLNSWQVEQLRQGRTKFTLGSYHIFDAIGKGGMGHLFKASHEMLGRVEAVKVLPRHKTTPESITSFLHEIRTQAQLDHPNLVRITYADRDGDTYFFVTEFVPGSDLRRLVRTVGPLTHSAAAYVVKQAAEGLEHAHRRGLIHRDIKPGNILVTPEGIAKVIDLGLAWFLEADIPEAQELDRLKIVGTADYLAPETINEPDRVMPVSDIYALGCTLYYAVTGKVPFPGGNPMEKMNRHRREQPIPAQQFNPTLPPGFVNVLNHMMDKNHATRVHTANACAALLDPWIDADAVSQLAVAVKKAVAQRGAPRASGKPKTPQLRADETLIYGAEEEAAIATGHPAQPTGGRSEVLDTRTNDGDDSFGDSQIIEIEPSEPVDRLDQAVKYSIWATGLVTIALLLALLWETLTS